MKNAPIVACDNLFAVLLSSMSGMHKVFLWSAEDETWQKDLDFSQIIPRCRAHDIELCKNLLAVHLSSLASAPGARNEIQQKTLLWQLDTSQPNATSSQSLEQ